MFFNDMACIFMDQVQVFSMADVIMSAGKFKSESRHQHIYVMQVTNIQDSDWLKFCLWLRETNQAPPFVLSIDDVMPHTTILTSFNISKKAMIC